MRKKEKKEPIASFAPPDNLDGAIAIEGGRVSHGYNMDISTSNEVELIRRYRDAARSPELADAIDEIMAEMVSENNEGDVIALDLSDLKYSQSLKDKMTDEFKTVLELFDFKEKGFEYIRKWYIDGRIYFHKIIDPKQPKKGIRELRYINPIAIKKIIETERVREGNTELVKNTKEYFQYIPGNKTKVTNFNGQGDSTLANVQRDFSTTQTLVNVSPEAIAYVTSGIYDEEYNTVLSYIHNSLRVVNQLKTLEDALVIYRLARAPERRIFYIDVGGINKTKAEQYLRDIMAKFKNTIEYDALTGEIKDQRRHLSMMEDFWIPRRENGKTTEVTTLPAAQNLGQLDDVDYFLKKMYKSLKVPTSRLLSEEQPAGLGRSSEISREEIKFQKFIDRLRNRFTNVILDVYATNLILKRVVSIDDWAEIKPKIKVEWAKDNFFMEMKEAEMIRERMNTLSLVDPFVGKYISRDYVYKNILRITDEDQEEIERGIEKDREEHPELFTDLMNPANPEGIMMPGNQPVELSPEEDAISDAKDKENINKAVEKAVPSTKKKDK